MLRFYKDLLVKEEGPGTTLSPLLSNPYVTFGWVFARCNEGYLTLAQLRTAFRSNGYQNREKRDAALNYLISNDFIYTDGSQMPKSEADVLRKYEIEIGGVPTDTSLKRILVMTQTIASTLKSGRISTRHLFDGLKEYPTSRSGYVTLDDYQLIQPVLDQCGGRVRQLYLYLCLTSVFKRTKVVATESFTLKKSKEKVLVNPIPFYIYPGESLSSHRKYASALGMDKRTVSRCIMALLEEKLIFVRSPQRGRTKIYKVRELMAKKGVIKAKA